VDGGRSEFELYDLAVDPKETADLKEKRPEDFQRMKEKVLAQISAVEEEGPEWVKRLSPNGAKAPDTRVKKGL
jgi:hypothetical protein